MNRLEMSRYLRVFLMFAAISVLAVCLAGISSCTKQIASPPEIQKYAKDWPLANKDFSNTRASMDSTINSGNVSSLGIDWSFPIPGISEWGGAATNPLILGNTVYLQDLKSNVHAINIKTGKPLWSKTYNLDAVGPAGPAVGWDKIFIPKGHYEVAALDTRGKEIWSVRLSKNKNTGIDIQPTAYGNMVYVSTVPGISNANFYRGGNMGVIYALDQNTGKVVWSFDTVDSKDIWGNPKVNSGGGCWYPPAIDINTDIMYWGIGNPGPWPGTKEFPNGSSRPGPNLYTNSLVALNQKDGKLVWYNQVLPHDLFDYDLQISPILASVTTKTGKRDIVIAAGKMGKVFAFDRKTGKLIWKTPVGIHKNDDLKALPDGVTKIAPGPLGGVETVMAYADGAVYVPVVNMVVEYRPTEFVAKSFDFASATGELVALDATNGEILWTKKLDALDVGAATVVNDLVFTSTFNGKIYAFNRKTGEEVWKYQAPGGINGWPAVSGDTIIFPVGVGPKPALIAFRVGAASTKTKANPEVPTGTKGKKFKQ